VKVKTQIQLIKGVAIECFLDRHLVKVMKLIFNPYLASFCSPDYLLSL